MHTLTSPNPTGTVIDADTLTCPGCHDTVVAEPPFARGPSLPGAEFSHRDGSELCTDGRGQVCEPIEARR